jgi:beta-lactamase regulating signal transducer with metallopeptidase domain
MIRFITYEGKAALVLLAFYLFVRFLLKKETFHRFNRMVLVGSALLSFILPLCIITIKKPMEEPLGDVLSPFTIGNATAEAVAEAPGIPWWHIALICLYWAGAAFVLVRLILSILSIYIIIRQGRTVSEEDGCKIIVTDRDIDPFSWMKYIVLSRNDVEKNSVPVIAHEMAHVKYGHSIEVLIVDIFSIFQWFNPAMWMLRSDLKEIHEYEADDAVLSNGINLKDYQYLLIRKAVGKSGYSVANSFNHSILKNRITMMSKSKSSAVRGLRVLYVLPLAGICLVSNAQTVIEYKGSNNPQTNYYASPTEIILTVIQQEDHADYLVKGEEVSLEKLGQKVLDARGDDASAYVSIVGETDVKTLIIRDVKEELRKVGVLKVQYTCFPNVKVQRRLNPSGQEKTREEFMETAQEGDIQIWINSLGKLLYGDGKYTAVSQEDLFARAKKNIEKNNGIAFYFVVDGHSPYGAYSAALQSVYYAYKSVREDLAMKTYGKPYDLLGDDQQDELLQKCRAKIYDDIGVGERK